MCSIKLVWSKKLKDRFNDLVVSKVFNDKTESIIVAHEDGILRTYSISDMLSSKKDNVLIEPSLKLETKGGPIQTITVHDVTRFGKKDVIVGDSKGMVTVFSNEQILTRRNVSEHCISCLQVQQDALGNVGIVTGDTDGHLSAFSPYEDLWRVRLADVRHQLRGLGSTPAVTSVLCTELSNKHGQHVPYVLAADSCNRLYLLQQGKVVGVYATPAVITSMCAGKFLEVDSIENSENSAAFETQVALASESGAIYVFTNFQVYHDELANVELPVTRLHTLPAADGQFTDSILCSGNFNALCVIRNGEVLQRYETSAWINALVPTYINHLPVTVIGCQDNTVHALSISFN